MKKRRSVQFMLWVTVVVAMSIGVTVKAVPPDMTPQQLEAEIAQSAQQEKLDQELAAALFSTAHRMAKAEVEK